MGHRSRRAFVLVFLLLLALPLSRSSMEASVDDLTLTLAERIAKLEEFRLQQRDWNHGMDERLSIGLTASQGAQDAHMAAIEEKLNTVSAQQMVIYAFGGLGSLLLVVGTPIAWSAYSKGHRKIIRYQMQLEMFYRLAGHKPPDDDED